MEWRVTSKVEAGLEDTMWSISSCIEFHSRIQEKMKEFPKSDTNGNINPLDSIRNTLEIECLMYCNLQYHSLL